jgi:hypothetical protein
MVIKTKKAFSKKSKTKTKKQNGSGIFSTDSKQITDIRYGKDTTNHETKKLICLQCTNNIFRHHSGLHKSRMRAFMLESDLFDKKYNIFVCTRCGFMMNYSGDITYTST